MTKQHRVLRSHVDADLHLDLTPLIDVVFLLLIFFMVSTSFETTHWLEMTLPTIDENNPVSDMELKPFIIGIDTKGHYHMNEQDLGHLDTEQLQTYLSEKINPESTVVIHGDQKAPHGAVVQLLDVLGKLNIVQIHMAALDD